MPAPPRLSTTNPVSYPTPYDGVRQWSAVDYPSCSADARVVTASRNGGHVWGDKDGVNFALESMLTFFDEVSRP